MCLANLLVSINEFEMVWCGVVWCGVVWCGVVWCGMVWYGMVWYGEVWYGEVWYGEVWCSLFATNDKTIISIATIDNKTDAT
jgi:hypothetical protein